MSAAALLFAVLSSSPAPVGAQTACRDAVTSRSVDAIALPRLGLSKENMERIQGLMGRVGFGGARYDPCARPLAVVVFEGGLLSQAIAPEAAAVALRKGLLSWTQVASHLPKTALTETSSPSEGAEAAERWLELLPGLEPDARRRAVVHALGTLNTEAERELARSLLGRELDAAFALGARDNVADLARALEANGWDVFFVGWTPQWLMEAVLLQLGFSPLQAVGTRTVRSPTGERTGELKAPFPSGYGKLVAVRTRIAPGGRAPRLVVGHAADDEALLEAAGPEGAMIIGNPEMLDRAEAAGWMQQ